ncbi:CBS domain-containing protein [Halobacteria archaeon AArc-curdl1]|uniref:CBS domain-containing protein n=1 Tax=Natronosalvus hydrolyticus TaxID=2979988 RepID=A0AAP2ZAQ2_9EURY|nr:CBS domain-containing protein [Halobacteria archaeon AArc-curdl1]
MAITEMATTDVVTASTETDVRELLEHMDEQSVGSVVITDGNEPVGIVTDRMIAMAFRENDSIDDLSTDDIMTSDLLTLEDDTTHFEALEMMSSEGIRRLPIVDADGSLAGIITLDDMLMVMAAELSNASDVIAQQTNA